MRPRSPTVGETPCPHASLPGVKRPETLQAGLCRGCSQLRARGGRSRAHLCAEGKKNLVPGSAEGLRETGERRKARRCPTNRGIAPAKSVCQKATRKGGKTQKTCALISKKFPQTTIPPTWVCPTPEKRKTSHRLPSNTGSRVCFALHCSRTRDRFLLRY